MKTLKYLLFLSLITLNSCNDILDIETENNVTTDNYYNNLTEIRVALNGCYNSLQKPIVGSTVTAELGAEWTLTELRSDNTWMSTPGSTSSVNNDLDFLDRFYPSPTILSVKTYWLNSYYTIKNVNYVLNSIGANYNKTSGTIEFGPLTATLTEAEKKTLTAEGCFIRGMQYFNLVRLFGDVMLIDEPLAPIPAKKINRSPVQDIYNLIITDLKYASENGTNNKYSTASVTGYANSWAAKALLAKVYLTLNRKTEAITLLNDVINNSGYGLETSYANVFSITNEMNKEILFSVRFKSGNVGLGNRLPNDFAPINSGSGVITGSGKSYNSPTFDIYNSYQTSDTRRDINIGVYGAGIANQIYIKKFQSKPAVVNDSENDWPVIRFSDVLLLLAEAQGNSSASMDLINRVHQRAGLTALPTTVTNAEFETALSNERRWELAFENQRFFDLLRFETTLSTIKAIPKIYNHYDLSYPVHYFDYVADFTLDQMKGFLTPEKLLLPIPQYEIDTNSSIIIPQNSGY